MSDLIDRQEAIEHCKKRLLESAYNNVQVICDVSYTMQEIADNRIENWLKELPSAQPKIIRCKDCKHYQFADNRAFGMPVKMCYFFGFEDVDDYDFCSRAERRINE